MEKTIEAGFNRETGEQWQNKPDKKPHNKKHKCDKKPWEHGYVNKFNIRRFNAKHQCKVWHGLYTHNTLPATFDDSLSYYECIAKLTEEINMLGENQRLLINEMNRVINVHNDLVKWLDKELRRYIKNVPSKNINLNEVLNYGRNSE